MIQLSSGDEYLVPFILLSEDELEMIQPGWERWLASQEYSESRRDEDFLLEAQARAYWRDRRFNSRSLECSSC
jgi:hypothetical protein